jgi:hypothetical protein
MGLIATMTALVLGLLIASAKSSFDTQGAELTEISGNVVLLDRVLACFGLGWRRAKRAILCASPSSALSIRRGRRPVPLPPNLIHFDPKAGAV